MFIFSNLQGMKITFFSVQAGIEPIQDETVNPLSSGDGWVMLLHFLYALVKL